MSKMNRKKLTDREIQDCESFRRLRVSCQMNQEQWAQATGISFGLVKKIEAHASRCSEKTKIMVQNFIDQYHPGQDAPDILGLETHILRDIFLQHMKHIPKNDAAVLSARCTRQMQDILAPASGLESSAMQTAYFQYLEQMMTIIAFAAADAVPVISRGENILDTKNGLRSVFTPKQITKYKQNETMYVSDDGEVSYQHSLFDTGTF